MLAWASEIFEFLVEHRASLAGLFCSGVAIRLLVQQMRLRVDDRQRDRRVRLELEAYARLDARMPDDGAINVLGDRVCKVVAEMSAFPRVALLVRDPEGRIYVAASTAMDQHTLDALIHWGQRVPERAAIANPDPAAPDGRSLLPIGTRSLVLDLPPCSMQEPRPPVMMPRVRPAKPPAQGRIIAAPLWTTGGRMVGALAVCTNLANATDLVNPLEALAVKLARTLENAALADRLLRTEKLAGLGQLAGGVAHALNNPLTAVLGYAELIAATSGEERVRQDAVTIAREALRMRETVQSLLDFCRPAVQTQAPVAMPELVQELAADCVDTLRLRGVHLVVQAADQIPPVLGNRDRLRQVLEHLFNNAAQAISTAQASDTAVAKESTPDHSIRVMISSDTRALQVIVSDTGPGFPEPGRVFDPFYTTREPGEGNGLGLSVCYGIIREHGGEIRAFNLHPRGAAVVVELPVRATAVPESVVVE